MANQPLQNFIESIKELLASGYFDKALEQLSDFTNALSREYRREYSLLKFRYSRIRSLYRKGLITQEQYNVQTTSLTNNILDLLDELERNLEQENFPYTSEVNISTDFPELNTVQFEHVIGVNNLKQIAWLQQSIDLSKSICRILTPYGYGSGFLIGSNRIMTNNHVLPTPEITRDSVAEFDYQQDGQGRQLPAYRFRISPNIFHTSPQEELDYTIVELEINQTYPPIENWGYLELNPHADPVPSEHVIIIQHPNGGFKQIALTNNQVVSADNQYLFYTTDTMPGSSGSPVFNDAWQVIAIHHAYGGIKQDRFGNNVYANEGILMSHIQPHAGDFWP